jgi:hypothetical protein
MGRKGSTYTCECCGKRTRETGDDESGVMLCAACYWNCQIDILISDYPLPAERMSAWRERRATAKPNTLDADTKALVTLWNEMSMVAKGGAA